MSNKPYAVIENFTGNLTYFSVNGNCLSCTHGGWDGYVSGDELYYDKDLEGRSIKFEKITYLSSEEYKEQYDKGY